MATRVKRKGTSIDERPTRRLKTELLYSILNPFPNEIWSYIFSFIKNPGDVLRLKLVCKGFKTLVEREFDHSYSENLPFWHCFNSGYLDECGRLLTDPRVLVHVALNFFSRWSKLADTVRWNNRQTLFIDTEILGTLKKLDPVPFQLFKHIITVKNITILEWALNEEDFPSELISGDILEKYYPIENDIVFIDLLTRVVPLIHRSKSVLDKDYLNTLFSYACRIGSLESCRLLIKRFGVSGLDQDDDVIRLACESRNLDLVKYLVHHTDNFSAGINAIFESACGSGDMQYISFLLKCPEVKVGYNIQSPLRVACKSGRVDVAQLLLEKNANPSVENQRILIDAADSNNTLLVKLLVNHHKIQNLSCSVGLFSSAVLNSNVELFQWLMNHHKIGNLSQVFVEIVKMEDLFFIKLLLSSPRFNQWDIVYQSVLRVIKKGSVKLAELLFECQPNKPTYYIVVLVYAVRHGHIDILQLLLQKWKFDFATLLTRESFIDLLKMNGRSIQCVNHILSQQDIDLGLNDGQFLKQVCQLPSTFESTIQIILEHPTSNLNSVWQVCFRKALESGNMNALKHLLKKEFVNPSIDNHFALQKAHENRNYDLMRLILDHFKSSRAKSLELELISFIKGQTFTDPFEKNAFLLKIANKDLSLLKNVVKHFLSKPVQVVCSEKGGCLFSRESGCLNNTEKLLQLLEPVCHCGYIKQKLKICNVLISSL